MHISDWEKNKSVSLKLSPCNTTHIYLLQKILALSTVWRRNSDNLRAINNLLKLWSYQQLEEEPGVFINVLSADASAHHHLKSQLFMKLLEEIYIRMSVTHRNVVHLTR